MAEVTDPQSLKELCQPGATGYLYNDFSPTGTQPQMNILHSAWCGELRKKGNEADLSSPKYHEPELYPLLVWLLQERGANWKPCSKCKLRPPV